MKKYDYLIVGAGLFGAVFAHEAKEAGKTCLVIDKRNHIAGNIYTDKVKDIDVQEVREKNINSEKIDSIYIKRWKYTLVYW